MRGLFCSGAAEMKPVYILELNVSTMMATSQRGPVYGSAAGNTINDENYVEKYIQSH